MVHDLIFHRLLLLGLPSKPRSLCTLCHAASCTISTSALSTSAAWSLHHQDLDVPFATQHIDAHVLLVADE